MPCGSLWYRTRRGRGKLFKMSQSSRISVHSRLLILFADWRHRQSRLAMSGFEVFSGVAAIFQLLEYGNRARSCVSDIVKKAKRPSQYLGELSEQVQGIIALAEVVNNEPSHISLTQPAIQKCINDSNALKEILRDLQDPLGKDVAIKLKERARLAIAWKGKEKAIEKAWKEIDRSMNILQFLVACNNNNVSSKILDAIGKSAGFSSFYPASACGGELSSVISSSLLRPCCTANTIRPKCLSILRWLRERLLSRPGIHDSLAKKWH